MTASQLMTESMIEETVSAGKSSTPTDLSDDDHQENTRITSTTNGHGDLQWVLHQRREKSITWHERICPAQFIFVHKSQLLPRSSEGNGHSIAIINRARKSRRRTLCHSILAFRSFQISNSMEANYSLSSLLWSISLCFVLFFVSFSYLTRSIIASFATKTRHVFSRDRNKEQ